MKAVYYCLRDDYPIHRLRSRDPYSALREIRRCFADWGWSAPFSFVLDYAADPDSAELRYVGSGEILKSGWLVYG